MKKIISIIVIAVVAISVLLLIPSHKNDATLVAYFSATGNTRAVAERLANTIGAELFEIKPATLYTTADLNYKDKKSRASVEMANRESRPEIADAVTDMSQYKIVFIGFPIWWGREPSITDTFVESYDFAGKTIVPFATSGSTPTTTEAATNIRALAPNANVLDGARFPNDVSADELKIWATEQF